MLTDSIWADFDNQENAELLKSKLIKLKEKENNQNLGFFKCYPDATALSTPLKVKNKYETGYQSVVEYLETIIQMERENFIAPIRQQLKKDEFDDIDMYRYHNVCIYPQKVTDPKVLDDYTCFLYFEPLFRGKKRDIVWEEEERLRQGSILLLSESKNCIKIEAICISCIPTSKDENLFNKFLEFLYSGIVPVKEVDGHVHPGKKYYAFEPLEIFKVVLVRMESIKLMNENPFPHLAKSVVFHNFEQVLSADSNDIIYNFGVLRKDHFPSSHGCASDN
ncbi:hypothetical protein TVAG_221930 [Trichomonas vaginalis G3]|uniref:Uncharacterized protein n=1 Tax=Trichomonas vaginalis (strain ATCC PRA-98 / G3) TaxID=412133 RepID=A2E3E8_TRIV3|nr:Nfx1-type zinc finger-containing protein family [Trichomonas vaginalis G3]EAY12839.1 hypothetical protein TVAG_221930 [Trichomonas vaginalis G3]KAI5488504.1 Nfx1-type zinc finger-containing protein family [Trichomonas vaginalis G3]|eukprot:XP_001325062.1 hypothetical protein [Trichomonas vaginalis G3]